MSDRKCSNCGVTNTPGRCSCGKVFYCSHACAREHESVHERLHAQSTVASGTQAEQTPVDALFRGIRGRTDFESALKDYAQSLHDYVSTHVVSKEAKENRGTLEGFKTWEASRKANSAAIRDVRKSIEDFQNMLKSVRTKPTARSIDDNNITNLSNILLSTARALMIHVEDDDPATAKLVPKGLDDFWRELDEQELFSTLPQKPKDDFVKEIITRYDANEYKVKTKRDKLAKMITKTAKATGKMLDEQWKKEMESA